MDVPSKIAMRERQEYPLDTEWCIPLNLPSLQDAKIIALDLETSDPDLKKFGPGWATFNGQILGISIATDYGYAEYFPINHAGENLDERTVLKWLKSELETDIPKVFANNYYDCGWLAAYGIHPKGPWYDIQIAAPLLDEHKFSYSLDNLGAEYCNEHKDERRLVEACALLGIPENMIKGSLHMLPAKDVAPYAIQDAVLTLKVWNVLEPKLHEEGLWSIFDLETRLSPALIAMRMKGVRLNIKKRDELIEDLKIKEADERATILKLAGRDVDIWSNKDIAEVFTQLDLPYYYTKNSILKAIQSSCNVPEIEITQNDTTISWIKTMQDSPVPLHELALNLFVNKLDLVTLLEKNYRPVHSDDLSPALKKMWREYKVASDEAKNLKSATIGDFEVPPTTVLVSCFRKLLNPSITGKFLEAQTDELSGHIKKARRWNKAISTFLTNSFTDMVVNGRIHCCYHQLKRDEGGTITGRFSCSNPNMQQVPVRDPEIGHLIRSLFIAEEGKMWASFDYSAQEPRILTHYCSLAEARGLISTESATELAAAYNENPMLDSHQKIADMITELKGPILGPTPKQRRQAAKTINLGKAYVMGLKKLALNLGISEEEAKPIVDAYDEGAAHIKAFQKFADRTAATKGFVSTLLGRKLHFPLWEPKLPFGDKRMVKPEIYEKAHALACDKTNEVWGNRVLKRAQTYKAINSIIQGSAADMTKKAMVELYEKGYIPVLQVHDELNFSDITSMEQVAEIKSIMENAIPLNVPIVCEAGTGTNWGDAH